MKILIPKIRYKPLQKGFTLIEMLAVIVILVIVGSIIFGVLFASLRGSNKAELITDVQENGNYALTEMVRTIRYAQVLESPAPCSGAPVVASSVTIRKVDNSQITYSCTVGSNGTIASNGASLLNTESVKVTACTFTCSQNNAYEAPTLGISFTLNKKGNNTQSDTNAATTFQTTVTLRNKK